MYHVYVKDGDSFPSVSEHLTIEEAMSAFQAGGRIERNIDGAFVIVKDDSQEITN